MALPSYRRLPLSVLRERATAARQLLGGCSLCVRRCGRDRLAGERGWCRAGRELRISGYGPHFGEEPPLVGRHGSGTIFFSHCTMGFGWQEISTSDVLVGNRITTLHPPSRPRPAGPSGSW